MKKVLAMILAMLIILSMLVACGPSEKPGNSEPVGSEAVTPTSKTLNVGAVGEPSGLLQQFTNYGNDNTTVIMAIFDCLVGYDSDTGEIIPELATSWEMPDAQTIVFHLREDVHSASGAHFTADDVLYCLRLGAENSALGVYYGHIDVENSYAENDYTVVVKLKYDYSTAVTLFAYAACAMCCEEDVTAAGGPEAFNTKPVGLGCYTFKSWANGQSITLVRNDNFWGEPAYYDEVVINFIPDNSARMIALQSGNIDAATYLSSADVTTLSGNTGFVLMDAYAGQNDMVWFNYANPILADVRVRQALAYAIDKNAIQAMAFAGAGELTDGVLSKTSPYYEAPANEDLAYNQNVEKAKALLAEAGYADGFSISIDIMQYQYMIDACTVLKSCWSTIGVDLNINVLDSGAFFANIYSGAFDMYYITSSGIEVAGHFKFFDSRNTTAGGNTISFNNTEMPKLMDAAKAEVDDAARGAIYADMQQLVREECAVAPIISVPHTHAVKAGLTGKFEPMGGLQIDTIRPE